jgi:2'-5' RNA ligase
MANIQSTIPGYRLNEYLIVLSPNEELRNRISGIRKEFNEVYRPSMPLNGKPHLALVRFVTWDMLEEKLVNRFHHIAMGFVPFKVELMGFGSFPSHSIYINVATKIPVQHLVKELRSAQKLMKADPEQEPHFITEPFIPVARKLLPWQYEKGWLEYSHRHFSAKMIVDGMLLLKRPVGEKSYRVVQRFEFMNMPVATTQGELFF